MIERDISRELLYECPNCASHDWGVSVWCGELVQEGNSVYRAINCDCGFEWVEVFNFVYNQRKTGELL